MVPKQDLGFRGQEWGMFHGRCSLKLVLGTEGEIPCYDRC